MILGVVVFKVVAVGTLLLGLVVLGPLVLGLGIAAAILFGLVGMCVFGIRFLLFCLRGFQPRQPPAAPVYPAARPGPHPVRPPVFAAGAPRWNPPPLRPVRPFGAGRYCQPHRGPRWGLMIVVAVLVCAATVGIRAARRGALPRVAQIGRAFKHRGFGGREMTHHPAPAVPPVTAQEDSEEDLATPPVPEPDSPLQRAFELEKPAEVAGTLPAADTKAPPAPPTPVASLRPELSSRTTETGEASWSVLGRGETSKDAFQDALEEAQARVYAYLRQQQPPIEWMPPREYVREHLVKEQRPEPPKNFGAPVGVLRQVLLSVEVTPADYRAITRIDREYRMGQRLGWLARVVAGLVALLAAVAGYIRLEEWSKGYYTAWLRVGAVLFLGAVGAGLWYLSL
jgi:hypothetical protein